MEKKTSHKRFTTFESILLLSLIAVGSLWTFDGNFSENPEAVQSRSTAAIIPAAKKEIFSKFKNWGLINSQTNSHISALDAWKIEEGSRDVIVAVIDTGVDTRHDDLKQNIWMEALSNAPSLSPVPSPSTSLLRVFGWDFVANKPNPIDEHGHGTHVAGIIGAVADAKTGVSGVAHRVSIMPVRYYSDSNPGTVNLRNTIQAIHYAIDKGARIINYSGGGPEYSRDEYLALKKAEARGILVVAAAGNERKDTDVPENFYYPAAYGLSNTISVAAIDINNKLLESSNWGKKKVDLVAPGENIYSTLPGNRYGYMSGTSQATAFVSGVAALVLSKNPSLSAPDLKRVILGTVDEIPSVASKVATGGRVNAFKAVMAANAPAKLATKPVVSPITRKTAQARSQD